MLVGARIQRACAVAAEVAGGSGDRRARRIPLATLGSARFPAAIPRLASSPGWLRRRCSIFVATWIAQTFHAYIQSGVAVRVAYRLGADVFERLQRQSLRFHTRHPAGDLVRRVTSDSRCAKELLIDICLPVQTAVVTLAAMFIVMMRMDVALSLIAMLVAPAIALVQKRYYQPCSVRLREQHEREAMMLSEAEQSLTAMPMLQAFRAEESRVKRFRETADETLRAYFRGSGGATEIPCRRRRQPVPWAAPP